MPAFLPGAPASGNRPLARYLPPLPAGAAARWLEENVPAGAWVLDPFGASPDLVVEAARRGYKVLVAANNPISRVLIEAAARPPSEADLRAALADLSAARKGGERLEIHIRSCYNTVCDRCGRPVSVDYFVWDKHLNQPTSRSYRCPNCSESGEHPALPSDLELAATFAAAGMHQARAIERVASIDDPDRKHAEEALDVYLPRAVYTLFNLINKLDSLPPGSPRRSCLALLLLHACDQANSLWAAGTARERPRQLSVPPRFRENNVWKALEEGVTLWSAPEPPIPLVAYQEPLPEGGGICLFEGRLKDLAAQEKVGEIAAVLTALPRPNQAFWSLSALWAGWIWGKASAAAFKSGLRRRRYDWGWHTAALTASVSILAGYLLPGTLVFGMTGEAEPGFLTAALTAAGTASFELVGTAIRGEQAQITWKNRAAALVKKESAALKEVERGSVSEAPHEAAREAGLAYLRERGQPADHLHLHCAALEGLVKAGIFTLQPDGDAGGAGAEPNPSRLFARVQVALRESLASSGSFKRLSGREGSSLHGAGAAISTASPEAPARDSPPSESGQWWLQAEPGNHRQPLSDRVEIAIVRLLLKQQAYSLEEIDRHACKQSPGLLTPSLELVEKVVESYACVQPESAGWTLKEGDSPSRRRADLENARTGLTALGSKLGFEVENPQLVPGSSRPGSTPCVWRADNAERFVFFILASAAISEPVFSLPPETDPQAHRIIVLPGSRANLVVYKLNSDPVLKAEVAQKGWKFLKYRLLRQLSQNPTITPESIPALIDLDPLTYADTQIRML